MASTKKQATSSDVRYALEYGKERLIRTYDMESHKTIYTLSPSNIRVPQRKLFFRWTGPLSTSQKQHFFWNSRLSRGRRIKSA